MATITTQDSGLRTQDLGFAVQHTSPGSRARTGLLRLPHGVVETPAFMPVGTQGSVKALAPRDLVELGTQIVLANTYHLYLRPGAELIAELGGLHRFMGWSGPLITDSGGYQVFSLGFGLEQGVGKHIPFFPDEPSGRRPHPSPGQKPRLARVDKQGVTFTSHLDGSTHRLTPEKSVKIQEELGADVILAFDEPTSPLHDVAYTAESLERTHAWARRSLAARTRQDQMILGIVQGGAYRELRQASARFIAELPFDGVAIGGSLGKSKREMHEVLNWTVPLLPEGWVRHLLGIGEPEDLIEAVARGIDLFDCVAPTRHARHGLVYTHYGKLSLTGADSRRDTSPIDLDCECYTCQNFSRAYLRHLFAAEELLAYRLATLHNLSFILGLMRRLREAIAEDRLQEEKSAILSQYRRIGADA